ncbi:MAG: hypothetical protein AAF798_10255 [Bacteroidota bacterium]
MQKHTLAIKMEVIEVIADQFANLYQKETDKPFPEHPNTTDFEKNETTIYIKQVIGELGFHPLKLYTYVYKPIRKKNLDEAKRLRQHPEGAVLWKITNDFPKLIFELLGYKDLEDLLIKNRDQFSLEVLETQKRYIDEYTSAKTSRNSAIIDAYYCYISDTYSYKVGKLAIYESGKLEMQLLPDQGKDLYFANTHFQGRIKYGALWITMDFQRTDINQRAQSEKLKISEVSFKFLPEDDFKEHIFIFGTYAAVDRYRYDRSTPARVCGPILLERMAEENFKNKRFSDIPFVEKINISPTIAAKVSGLRWEERKRYDRKSTKAKHAEQREEELALINKHNLDLQYPERCIGSYVCLVPSKRHRTIRKILFTISTDLTIAALSTNHINSDIVIEYAGQLKRFVNGHLEFLLHKKDSKDYMTGHFIYQEPKEQSYGLLGGIFNNALRSGRAILIPVSESLAGMTDITNPGFLRTDSSEYQALDAVFQLSKFYAGKSIDPDQHHLQFLFNDDEARFSQLLQQSRGDFKEIQGLFEEYYFDHNQNVIRKDYLLILENGAAFMRGLNTYKGWVEKVGSKYLIDFRSTSNEQLPVLYLLQHEEESEQLLSGIFTTDTEDRRNIATNIIFLHRIDHSSTNQKNFFNSREYTSQVIRPQSPAFNHLNTHFNNLGNRLLGRIGNYLLARTGRNDRYQGNNRRIAQSFFFSACYQATQGGYRNLNKAKEDLQVAFQHGFRDRILLDNALKEGKPLHKLKEIIDVENFCISEDGLKDVG